MPDGNTQILLPMPGLMVLTAVVWFVHYAKRIPAWNAAQAAIGQSPG